MNILTILLIAFGLAMDAFAVSISHGITVRHERLKSAFRVAFFFGFFQAIMPVCGWLAGLTLKNFIAAIDHWIAFALLCFIGAKMIYDALKTGSGKEKHSSLDISTLLVLSIATSIDALAIGVTFAFLNFSIVYPVIIIGAVTFILSFLGVFIGVKFDSIFGNRAKVIGGVVLISIGIKILIEHLAGW